MKEITPNRSTCAQNLRTMEASRCRSIGQVFAEFSVVTNKPRQRCGSAKSKRREIILAGKTFVKVLYAPSIQFQEDSADQETAPITNLMSSRIPRVKPGVIHESLIACGFCEPQHIGRVRLNHIHQGVALRSSGDGADDLVLGKRCCTRQLRCQSHGDIAALAGQSQSSFSFLRRLAGRARHGCGNTIIARRFRWSGFDRQLALDRHDLIGQEGCLNGSMPDFTARSLSPAVARAPSVRTARKHLSVGGNPNCPP